MGIEIFDYTKSDRAERLWNAVKEYIKPGSTVLDIGCGNAPLAHYAKSVPGVKWTGFDNHSGAVLELRKQYPAGEWTHENYPGKFTPELRRRYDVIIHIGVDKEEYSPISGLHAELIKAGYFPDAVLLESGYAEEYQGPYNAYCKAMAAYLLSGKYEIADSGKFPFDVAGHHLKERAWSVLRRRAEAPAC
ncbi:MAG: methionine biosynthesis protein MetW [Sphaerochaeta sp.]|jgi:hypothetical protein|nr:methionine biosynthesis protein MetW [Sphaerochaeta sp.]